MTINDSVFGNMVYDAGWEKGETLTIWGEEIYVRIVAKAYTGQDILDSQREGYMTIKSSLSNLENSIKEALLGYYKKNYNYIVGNIDNIPFQYSVNEITAERIIDLIKIKTLIFDRKGNFGFLCDCAWNTEDGIAIKLNSKVEVGEQDLLI